MDSLFNFPFLKELPLKKNEKTLLKSYFLVGIYHELKKIFYLKKQNGTKANDALYTNKDCDMIDTDFLCDLIKDILSTEDFSLIGIANYIRTPEEVIYDLISGINKSPSPNLWIRLIELHILVKRELYQNLIKKIISHNFIEENRESE